MLLITIGVLALYFTYRSFNPISKESGSSAVARALLPQDTRVHVCAGPGCVSYIEVAGQRLASVERGIAVLALRANNDIEQLALLDHCTSREVYAEAPPIRSVIRADLAKSALATRAIVFLSSDTVNCDFDHARMDQVDRWLEGVGLKKFPGLGVRDAYLGVLDPQSMQHFEMMDRRSFTFRR